MRGKLNKLLEKCQEDKEEIRPKAVKKNGKVS
jgi:hypothetical protein